MTSFTWMQGAFIIYLAATLLALVAFALGRARLQRLVFWVGWAGMATHTLGLGFRWYEGGVVELAATEKVAGRILEGWDRWAVLASHPPFTNLYESLVFFGWSLVLAGLLATVFWRGKRVFFLLVAAMVLADLTMGLASLHLNQSIKPLVPALQSWWLHVHVITAFLGYACFFLAAIGAVLYLVLDGISDRVVGIAAVVVGVITVISLAGGIPWPGKNDAGLIVLREAGRCEAAEECRGSLPPYACQVGACVSETACTAEVRCPAEHRCQEGRCVLYRTEPVFERSRSPVKAALPATTAVLTAALVAFLLLGGWLVLRLKPSSRVVSLGGVLGALGLAGACLAAWLEGRAWDPARTLGVGEIPGGAFVSLRSAPYEFALLLFGCLMLLFLSALVRWRGRLAGAVPDTELLDRMVLRSIQAGFPMMTLTIVTGAVWANYAWGRPWGWDPKETWSLISWIVYAAYLHARFTHGWRGRRAALVAILGFAVVVFTFLGVNLGFTGSGLHSYGAAF